MKFKFPRTFFVIYPNLNPRIRPSSWESDSVPLSLVFLSLFLLFYKDSLFKRQPAVEDRQAKARPEVYSCGLPTVQGCERGRGLGTIRCVDLLDQKEGEANSKQAMVGWNQPRVA